MFFERTYTIDSRDLDCFNRCRPSALLGYLQEAAGQAATAFHAANPQMMEKYGKCWMVVRTRCTLERPLRWGDALTIKTWHRGNAHPLMYRDFDLQVNGERAGEALAVWALVDWQDRSIAKLTAFPELEGTDGGGLIRTGKLLRLRPPGALEEVETRRLHYSDTDGNGHVNNTRYADYLCDALRMDLAGRDTFLRELQVDYLQECRAGEELRLKVGTQGERHYVLGEDLAGVQRFLGYGIFSQPTPPRG